MVLLGTSCFDEVSLAETVASISQFMKQFDQIFYLILTYLIFFFLFSYVMVLFKDNHKFVEAHLF